MLPMTKRLRKLKSAPRASFFSHSGSLKMARTASSKLRRKGGSATPIGSICMAPHHPLVPAELPDHVRQGAAEIEAGDARGDEDDEDDGDEDRQEGAVEAAAA